jgi:hypothetical protein
VTEPQSLARPRPWLAPTFHALAVVTVALGALAFEAIRTAPVRDSVRAYTALITAANKGDLTAVRSLCSTRYLNTHAPKLAEEGGVVGLPRGIHPNFRAWQEGEHVRICPTNRDHVGPVYRFVRQGGSWRFDGPIGLLYPGGRFVAADEATPPEGEAGR